MQFVCYPKCTTCQKAKKWLEGNDIAFDERHIKQNNPILKTYQAEVDIPNYAGRIRTMLTELQETYGYSGQDAMPVLKDILAHEYMDNRKKDR